VMGWKDREFYAPAGGEAAWDTYGNAGPTVWVDGQVVGAWGQAKDGEIRVHYFAAVPTARQREVQRRARDVEDWLGETRISWRFPGAINTQLLAPV
ncbi:MAG: crosslink repair DNA glycosylase YcaQ family protein, partial [Ornithinimicrobium sp.]